MCSPKPYFNSMVPVSTTRGRIPAQDKTLTLNVYGTQYYREEQCDDNHAIIPSGMPADTEARVDS